MNGAAGLSPLEPYPDGRWTVADHEPGSGGPIWCRGNVGEVFPNVMTPLSSSLYIGAIARGQARASFAFGAVTRRQYADFHEADAWSTGVFGGYLYANVSLARTAVARAPGLTVEMLDREMFGLTGAPPHHRGRGERNIPAAVRTLALMQRSFRRPDDGQLRRDQEYVAAYVDGAPEVTTAGNDELFALTESLRPVAERMMYSLLIASAIAGFGRIGLERVLGNAATPDVVNRLVSGLGTIESAEPAVNLWRLGRIVANSDALTAIFDAGPTGVEALARRLAHHRGANVDEDASAGAFADAIADASVARFCDAWQTFTIRHGARGPDEWELASPTWGSDPHIGLAIVDRLRTAPGHRDPLTGGLQLSAERERFAAETRNGLPRTRRGLFDRAMRAASSGATQREATKAAYVRALYPARQALAELARRSGLAHGEFFLLTLPEARAAMTDPEPFLPAIAERRVRQQYLQSRVPPFWFDGELPPPHTWELRARQADAPITGERVLTGLGVCGGTATGTARIVTDPAQPGELGPGDILVAPITDPAWTPLFLAADGLVVDVGAQLSHAAIVARELGIPAVVSVAGASATIPDGARVTVDGSRGEVTVHAPTTQV